jgi:aryl-phospho-beta-D-glucosidase BglC (GH1 family)
MKQFFIAITIAAVICAVGLFVGNVKLNRKIEMYTNQLSTVNQEVDNLSQAIVELTGLGNGVRRHGSLRVEESQLVDEYGDVLQLRGMSSHGLTWYPQYINAGALSTIKGYGANLFRAAMYTDNVNSGYNENYKSMTNSKAFLSIAVENALELGMYVIIDWHILRDNNPLTFKTQATEFFNEISQLYGDNPGIIYEICNEPNGDTTWQDITDYAEMVIPVIRKNAPNSIIIVGTPRYSSDITAAIKAPLDFDNVMYAFHHYIKESGNNYEHILKAARDAELPVFVSEWGIGTGELTEKMDSEKVADFLRYMKDNHLSWANWSLSNSSESYSAIRSDIDKLSGWTLNDLTLSGQIIFQALGDE